MSQYEPPQYTSTPLPDERPTAVTVIGIINIIFGALGLTCLCISLVTMFMPQPYEQSAALRGFGILNLVISLALSGALLASGIGLMSRSAWARMLAIRWAIANLVWSVISLVASIAWVMPETMAAMADRMPPEQAAMASTMTYVFLGISVLFMIYPVLVLIFMRKPHVIAWTDRVAPAPYTPPPAV